MKKESKVVLAFCRDKKDNILMGKRNDNGKYTVPGGHLEKKESEYDGMAREFKEETGLTPRMMKLACCCRINDLVLYIFEVKVDPSEKVDTSKDPDKECDTWDYIDPIDVINELHVSADKNVILHYWANN